ncbi:helix-turn-helix domain-containing protein [Sporosarcina sp. G11-34]|uniref:helix-turn-helix domain-containing protein n=1 Tax=Sporosarcina sp. G11-34 TaxID=2849605 RepID=UPI0022A9F06B|nr:helix-turn-helix transcriptional regulator [Sporosarcina sp. G11-34]MCZ2259415.1 helix-turn-helix domain-containing protein [Sporosarcina sp. G11-34]
MLPSTPLYNIHSYKTQRGISQEELAFKSGLDRTYISLLERGKRKPTINTIFAISIPLNERPSKLIKEVEDLLSCESNKE